MLIKIIKILILIGFLISPYLNLYEYGTIISGSKVTEMKYTPIWIKAIKDLLIILIATFYFLYVFLYRNSIPKISYFILGLILLIVLSIPLSIANLSLLSTIISLRIYVPFLLLIFVSYEFFNDKFMEKIFYIVCFNSIIESLLILYQVYINTNDPSPLLGSINLFGVIQMARGFGTMGGSASSAIFLAISLAAILFYNYKIPNLLLLLLMVLLVITILTTGSASGVMSFATILLIKLFYKSNELPKYVREGILLIAVVIYFFFLNAVLTNIETIIGREGWTDSSALTRIRLFEEYVFRNTSILAKIMGNGLGTGSNTLSLIAERMSDVSVDSNFSYISDSTITMLISQIGFLGLFLFLLLNTEVIIRAKKMKLELYLTIILIVLISGSGLSILEFFPVNWLYGIIIGQVYKKYGLYLKRKNSYSQVSDLIQN